MIQIPTCSYTQPEIIQSDTLKDDNKWYASGKNGKQRPLQFNISNGSWVTLLKAEGEGTRGRHHHSASVSAWTIEGAWGYREYDWVALLTVADIADLAAITAQPFLASLDRIA